MGPYVAALRVRGRVWVRVCDRVRARARARARASPDPVNPTPNPIPIPNPDPNLYQVSTPPRGPSYCRSATGTG